MGGASSTQADLTHGFVAPGFENVQKMFEHNLRSGQELQAQLCVYVGGKLVVDLWGSISADDGFTGDSLINAFSSTKSLTAIAIAKLVEKGLLDYDAKIVDYWPEFGRNGKSEITLAQLMRHEAGLPFLETSVKIQSLLTENIKKNEIGNLVENQKQILRQDGEARQYHALTRGWIANEIFRRVHPDGVTIGQFLRKEITEGMGADVYIGLYEEEIERVIPVKMCGWVGPVVRTCLPKHLGRQSDFNIFELPYILHDLVMKARTNCNPAPPIEGMGPADPTIFNAQEVMIGEVPSANGHASARGLGKVASAMANHGKFEGKEMLTKEAWELFHADAKEGDMVFHKNIFTQGGLAKFGPVTNETKVDRTFYERRKGFYGWYGFGGSVFQWHPDLQIGFAYIPSLLSWIDMANNKGGKFQELIVNILNTESL